MTDNLLKESFDLFADLVGLNGEANTLEVICLQQHLIDKRIKQFTAIDKLSHDILSFERFHHKHILQNLFFFLEDLLLAVPHFGLDLHCFTSNCQFPIV